MNLISSLVIIIGLIVFLIGYWFLALSYGEKECVDPNILTKSSINAIGGIAGIVIGLIIMILGIILAHSDPAIQIQE